MLKKGFIFAKFNTSILFFLVFFLVNLFFWHSAVVGIGLLTIFLTEIGGRIGSRFFPQEGRILRRVLGVWIFLSVLAIAGSVVYYTGTITSWKAMLGVLLSIGVTALFSSHRKKEEPSNVPLSPSARHPLAWRFWILAVCGVFFLLATLALLHASATQDAVRSVWETVPSRTFLFFGLSATALSAVLLFGRAHRIGIALAVSALFVFLSAAVVLFPLGYGFDPFIHQATENHIAAFGTITPKPFYYIGQYALILFSYLGFLIPIETADRWLVPVLSVLLLPAAWSTAALSLLRDKRLAAASLLLLFLLPLDSLILTTPQGLANLWTLLTILLAVPRLVGQKEWPWWPTALSAFATLLIHPLAGLPAVIFVFLASTHSSLRAPQILSGRSNLSLKSRTQEIASSSQKKRTPRNDEGWRRLLSWATILFSSIIFPLAFWVQARLSDQPFKFHFNQLLPSLLKNLVALPSPFPDRYSPIFDVVYFFGTNRFFLLFVAASAGILLWKRWMKDSAITPLLVLPVILLINFLLLKTVTDFSFLIDYEQSNYADRLLTLTIFFLVPFLILAGGHIADWLRTRPLAVRIAAAVFLAAAITGSWYLAYPRHDVYATGHGYNVSRADIEAVRSIETNAGKQPYVVLANQTTSAAAMKEFGFAHYYKNNFYYPIPTGGPLYKIFLEMNDFPSRETAAKAASLSETEIVYFLVSSYWWQADRIEETAKTQADRWWKINGKTSIVIFQYDFSNP
ncbi:MAG TPA: hypothetical protein VJB99_00020 [Patescibacteria group bacterium]|nr:hypothetical protein [Patescibacteria group bacterium]